MQLYQKCLSNSNPGGDGHTRVCVLARLTRLLIKNLSHSESAAHTERKMRKLSARSEFNEIRAANNSVSIPETARKDFIAIARDI